MRMLYGEGIYYNMDSSSYMYSTIWGALEYLETIDFKEKMDKKYP